MVKKQNFDDYEDFKVEMLDLIDDYRDSLEILKEVFYDLTPTTVLLHIGEMYNVLSVMYYGTKLIAGQFSIEDIETQHNYLARFLDDLFEFDNVFVEQFDQILFGLMLDGIERLFDATNDAKTRDDFFSMADMLLKKQD